jgi:hypothetical protein
MIFIILGQMDLTGLWLQIGWLKEDLELYTQMERAILKFFENKQNYIFNHYLN